MMGGNSHVSEGPFPKPLQAVLKQVKRVHPLKTSFGNISPTAFYSKIINISQVRVTALSIDIYIYF